MSARSAWVRTICTARGYLLMYLYLVSGLLLSYRFSSAIGKWDEGKQVWSGVRTTIRDGIRMVSFAVFYVLRESLKIILQLSTLPGGKVKQVSLDGYEESPDQEGKSKQKLVSQRIDELSGLLVSFAFALQWVRFSCL